MFAMRLKHAVLSYFSYRMSHVLLPITPAIDIDSHTSHVSENDTSHGCH